MDDCCKIAGTPDSCEAPTAMTRAMSSCPECGRKGRPIQHRTPEHQLTDAARPRLLANDYWFCGTPGCPVVYFSSEGGSVFHKPDIRVRVTRKETEDPIPVCYCYGHTRADIERDIRTTGTTAIPDSIKTGVKAGTCACEEKNPQGSCCLGNVNAAVAQATSRITVPAR